MPIHKSENKPQKSFSDSAVNTSRAYEYELPVTEKVLQMYLPLSKNSSNSSYKEMPTPASPKVKKVMELYRKADIIPPSDEKDFQQQIARCSYMWENFEYAYGQNRKNENDDILIASDEEEIVNDFSSYEKEDMQNNALSSIANPYLPTMDSEDESPTTTYEGRSIFSPRSRTDVLITPTENLTNYYSSTFSETSNGTDENEEESKAKNKFKLFFSEKYRKLKKKIAKMKSTDDSSDDEFSYKK